MPLRQDSLRTVIVLLKVQHIPDHLYELPEDITPAVMNQAVYGKTDMTDFSATVMDLVRKKVLKLSDTEPYTITLVDDKQRNASS